MRLAFVILAWLFTMPAFAQVLEGVADATEDRGRFIEFIENQLNTDNRIIRVRGIEGALSSRATIDLITVADREGVWLRLEGNVIDWSRSALFRGRLEVEQLSSERVEVLRTPLPDPDALPSPEASGGLSIPELPLAINVERLAVQQLFIAEPLLGVEATVAIEGSLSLEAGGLAADLAANRLDGPGGTFRVALGYVPNDQRFAVDVVLDEPADGIVANLANIEGRPALRFVVQGEGPLDDLSVSVTLDSENARLLDGSIVLAGTSDGRQITADLDGALAPLLPATVRDFVGASSTLDVVALQRTGGGFTVDRFALDSGEVQLAGALRTAADGFLELLDVEGTIAAADGGRVDLPGGAASVTTLELDVDYGTGETEGWNAAVRVEGIDAGTIAAGEAIIEAEGTLSNPGDPAARAVTFAVDGDVRGLSSPDAAIASALGEQLRLDARGAWQSGQPVRLESAALTGRALRAVLAGVIEGTTYDGEIGLSAASLAPFSAIAGRDLAGALTLDAVGTVAPLAGVFDIALDGSATGLRTGIEAADELLDGTVALDGRLARTEAGLVAEAFRIDGEAIVVTANGTLASENADFTAAIELAELSDVTDRATGAARAEARIVGSEGSFDVDTAVEIDRGTLIGRELRDARFAFDGTIDGGDVVGALSGDGSLDGEPVSLTGDLATLGDVQQVEDFVFRAGEARLDGGIRRNANGQLDGTVTIDAPDVSTLAALALTDATGSVVADVTLASRANGQAADVEAAVEALVVGDTRVGSADVTATITDLFGVPAVDGRADGSDIVAGGVQVSRLTATADGTVERTAFEAEATLAEGAELELAGALRPLARVAEEGRRAEQGNAGGGFALDLDRLAIVQATAELELVEPTTVTVAEGTVALEDVLASIGNGTLRASGSAGERLDLTIDLDRVGLDVVNALRPDLALAGNLTGSARVTGTPADPEATFDLAGDGLAAAPLRAAGIEPLSLRASGRLRDNVLRVPSATIANTQGIALDANAVVPIAEGTDASLMANLAIEAVPLSIANGFREGLDASGTASGTASVAGSLGSPEATFRFQISEATAAPVRDAGVEPLDLVATGSYADSALRLSDLTLDNAQGVRATAMGTVPLAGPGLDLDVQLEELPLAIGGFVIPDLGLEGTVQGSLDLTGTLREPRGGFRVEAAGVAADPLRAAGVAPIDALAVGEFTSTGVFLETARVTNGQGLALTATGNVPLAPTDPLDLDVGIEAAPLALAATIAPDLDPSGTLSGTANVTGTLREPRGTFDIATRDATATPLREAGIEPIDAAAEGELLDGAIRIGSLSIVNPQGLDAAASGTVPLAPDGPVDLEIALEAVPLALANVARPDLELSGTVAGTAAVAGTLAAPTGTFDVRAADLSAAPLVDNGIAPIDARATGDLRSDRVVLTDLRLSNEQGIAASASGTVPLSTTGELDVDVSLESVPLAVANAVRPDLDLAGRVTGTASLEGNLPSPTGTFDLRAVDVSAEPLSSNGIAPVEAVASGELRADRVVLRDVRLSNDQGIAASATGTVPFSTEGELQIDVSLDSVPLSVANAVRPDLELAGRVTGSASVSGSLATPTGTFDVQGRGITAAPLRDNAVQPLDIDLSGTSDGRTVRLADVRLSNAQGISAGASGTVPLSADGPIDVDLRLDSVPLSVANAVRPDLALGGRVSGTASVAGSPSAPTARFDVTGDAITAAPLRDQGIAPIAVSASASSDGRSVTLDRATASNGQGIAVSASGRVPFDPDAPIDVDVRLEALPLDALGGGGRASLGLGGRITGSASVAGSVTSPRATFDLDGAGITAAALRGAGVDPVSLSVDGSFEGNAIRLASARASNPQGMDVIASGTVPFDGGALSVQLDADAPLALAEPFLADRGTQLGGQAQFSGSITGSASDPSINGLVSTQNASVVDPLTNLRVPSLDVSASVVDNRLTLRAARGALGTGGVVSASGTIDPLAPGVPADLSIVLDDARYTDGENIVVTVDGRLTITGQLTASPLISGTIDVVEANVTVPESLGASGDVFDVRHIEPPIPVMRTLERARVGLDGRGGNLPGGSPSGPRLDVTVNAPNRIFIRGRGLDAEVGGRVRLRGPVSDVQPTGQFELIRGRLSILTQRITFDRGTVTLIGDLDPFIDFRATTRVDDVQVIVDVRGRASDLDITFSSDPELPEDEVLARLIFGRSIDELSPIQIARLAAAAAELAGTGGPSLFGGLREATGLDDLDVTVDDDGNAAVRAGRYINDNIYLGAEAGQGGGRVTIDIDITDDLKARASTGAEETKFGVFFEKDF